MEESGGRGLLMEAQYLKGVGPRTAMHLNKIGLFTVGDVLSYLPRRYEDRTALPPITLLKPGEFASARGRLVGFSSRPLRGGKVMIRATIEDETGGLDLVFFNQPWVQREMGKAQGEIIAFGLVKEGRTGGLEMSSPEWEADGFARIVPIYPLKEGVPQWAVRRAAQAAAQYFAPQAVDPVPAALLKQERLPSLSWALSQIHLPDTMEHQAKARARLAYDEFLALQLTLEIKRRELRQEIGAAFPISKIGEAPVEGGALFGDEEIAALPIWGQIGAMLPFDLTGAQKRVIGEVFADMESEAPMNRLVQGDVGSGKTAVAACAMLAAVRCGWQAALMAPTEILAEQHGMNLKRMFAPLGIEVRLLVGKQAAKVKRRGLQMAASGEAQICVGTHALIQEGVQFAKLGLAVIDEQHRFGVLQRAALRQKGLGNPDVLVMTATPIPRTLTMSVYGDLDVSVIDELPPGRKPIKTHWKLPHDRDSVYANVRKLIEQGRQAYFVCPAITESEKLQAAAAEDLHHRLSHDEYPDLKVGLLHGQMKPVHKEAVMEQFRTGELNILVSTVVIEVGVDVPNASVMVIEDANRFGLSQLHQLRGRVGRGEWQSYCILIGAATSPDTEARLSTMVRTTDGFEIAEEDLRIRGPGDLIGVRQSGAAELKVADLVKDMVLLQRAKDAARRILDDDPNLAEHPQLLDLARRQRTGDALISIS
jgi:ATP-dependent DNA helicase RecG